MAKRDRGGVRRVVEGVSGVSVERREVDVVVRGGGDGLLEGEGTAWADSPVVDKVQQRCPRCGSVRSKQYKTEPCEAGGVGRMEFRTCDNCACRFRVWDEEWRRRGDAASP